MKHRRPTALAFLLAWATGCAGSVMPAYKEARLAALADPGPPPRDWQPDAVLHLAPDTLDAVLEGLLTRIGALRGTLDAGVARLEPRLDITSVVLHPAERCESCLAVDLDLDGIVKVSGPLVNTRAKVSGKLAFDAVFEVVADAGGVWQLGFVPRRVRNVDLRFNGSRLAFADAALQDFVAEQIFADLPVQHIATLGNSDLPLRAVRVHTSGRFVQLHLLTRTPDARPVTVERRRPARWQLDLSEHALVGLAAAEAYRQGPVARNVVPVPTSLSIEPDGSFTLGLRLWRIKGRGWWRDYVVQGRARLTDDGIRLTPTDVAEAGKSRGAAVVDPLAFLGEGVILDTIEEVLRTSLPATYDERLGGVRTRVGLEALSGSEGVVHVAGSLEVLP